METKLFCLGVVGVFLVAVSAIGLVVCNTLAGRLDKRAEFGLAEPIEPENLFAFDASEWKMAETVKAECDDEYKFKYPTAESPPVDARNISFRRLPEDEVTWTTIGFSSTAALRSNLFDDASPFITRTLPRDTTKTYRITECGTLQEVTSIREQSPYTAYAKAKKHGTVLSVD